jgi:ABC-type phosphate/phosphonate transport system substrate-binding protein
MYMKRKALLISILFITSILAGCTGNDEDTAKDEMILSLESEIKNITAEKEEALGNNLLLQHRF